VVETQEILGNCFAPFDAKFIVAQLPALPTDGENTRFLKEEILADYYPFGETIVAIRVHIPSLKHCFLSSVPLRQNDYSDHSPTTSKTTTTTTTTKQRQQAPNNASNRYDYRNNPNHATNNNSTSTSPTTTNPTTQPPPFT